MTSQTTVPEKTRDVEPYQRCLHNACDRLGRNNVRLDGIGTMLSLLLSLTAEQSQYKAVGVLYAVLGDRLYRRNDVLSDDDKWSALLILHHRSCHILFSLMLISDNGSVWVVTIRHIKLWKRGVVSDGLHNEGYLDIRIAILKVVCHTAGFAPGKQKRSQLRRRRGRL